MTPENTIYELFEQYLAGELPAAETAAFEQRLQTEPGFREQFELYKNLQQDFALMESSRSQEAALTETLQGYNRQYFTAQQPQQGKVVSMKRRWYMIAAAASLIAAFFLLKPMLFTASDKNLFNEYYTEERLDGSRSEADSVNRITELFNAKKYTGALTILEPYTAAHPDATSLIMAKGVCYMQTGAYEKANTVFTPIASGQTMFAARARWMLAMVALKQDNKAACKLLLEKIPATSDYFERAQRLLKQL